MYKAVDQLKAYLDCLQETALPGCTVSASVQRTVGNQILIKIPNGDLYRCPLETLTALAEEMGVPVRRSQLSELLLHQSLQTPSDFFATNLLAIAICNGFGTVNLDLNDARSFIGSVGLSYRGRWNRP